MLPPTSALNLGDSRGHRGGQGKTVSKADKRLDPSSKWGIKLYLKQHYSSHSYFIVKCDVSFTSGPEVVLLTLDSGE